MELEGIPIFTATEAELDKYEIIQEPEEDEKALIEPEKEIPYPKSIIFIVATEFCERFSYAGMKTVLTLYLRNALRFSESTSTIIYHAFITLCFCTPILGGILADSFLGRFRTILYLAVIYSIGNITLTLASAPPSQLPTIPFSLLGLVFIAIGTGGIKPCVLPFGADQFVLPSQEKYIQQFFFCYYFAVNSGSLLSTFVSPILRKDISCFGSDTCYSLAFCVPAALWFIALLVFVLGKPFYKVKMPKGNVLVQVIECICHAIRNYSFKNRKTKRHWLEWADDTYDKDFIEDVKRVFKILVLFIPLPIYWSCFEQQGSTWTLQATRMNGFISNNFSIKPDQVQAVNSVLVLLLIPTFESIIYPTLTKLNLLRKPLQRMIFGGCLAAGAFVIAGVVELQLRHTYPIIPNSTESSLNFVNTLPCRLNVTLEGLEGNSAYYFKPLKSLLPFENYKFQQIPAGNYSITITPKEQTNCLVNGKMIHNLINKEFEAPFEKSISLLISLDEENSILLPYSEDDLTKSREGNSKIRIAATGFKQNLCNVTLIPTGLTDETILRINDSQTIEVQPKEYSVFLDCFNTTVQYLGDTKLGPGGSYLMGLIPLQSGAPDILDKELMMEIYVLTKANTIHILLLFPQFIVLTFAEIFFSITGYSFSYLQAPATMKSVITSIWLINIAVGSFLVILFTQFNGFVNQANQFFLFSGLMILSMMLFTVLAYRYRPTEVKSKHQLAANSEAPKEIGNENTHRD